MPRKSKSAETVIDDYIGRFEASRKSNEKKLAYLIKRKRKTINTADVYKDDPTSIVLALVDGIYNPLKDISIDSLLYGDKIGKEKVAEECEKLLDNIVAFKLKFKRTDIKYDSLVKDVLKFDEMCNRFYDKASRIAKMKTEEGLVRKVSKLHKPAADIMKNAPDGDDIGSAIKSLIADVYTFPEAQYIVTELEWAQVNCPELGQEFEDTWNHMVEMSAELQSDISDKEKLKNIITFDKEYERFNAMRKEIREKIRESKQNQRYERWRDVV